MPLAKQTLNAVKSIEAVNGMIKINLYPPRHDLPHKYEESYTWSIDEALRRAKVLNDSAARLPEDQAQVFAEAVTELLAKIVEAKEQVKMGKAPKVEEVKFDDKDMQFVAQLNKDDMKRIEENVVDKNKKKFEKRNENLSFT